MELRPTLPLLFFAWMFFFAPALPGKSLVVDQKSLTFTHFKGTPTPSAESVDIKLSGREQLTDLTWAITPSSGSFTNLFLVTRSTTGLLIGVNASVLAILEMANVPMPYAATLKISSSQANNSPEVKLIVSGAQPASFSLGATSLSFGATAGSTAPISQLLAVTSTNRGTDWAAVASTSSGGNWLGVSPAKGTGSGTITVAIYPAGLAAGTYSGTVMVVPVGLDAVSASITLTVGATGSVAYAPSYLAFFYGTGGAVPSAQQVTITGNPGVTITAQPSGGATWLLINGSSAQTGHLGLPATLNISVDPTGLASTPATYAGSIVVSATDGSYVNIGVTLGVNAKPDTLTVNPIALTFAHVTGTPLPDAQQIDITLVSSGNTPSDLSAAITPGTAKYEGLFKWQRSGNGVLVFLDSAKLGSLEAAGEAKPYTATIAFTSTDAPGSNPSVPLTVSNTPATSFSLGATTMSFTAPYGSSTPLAQPLTLTSTNSATAWSASASTVNGGNWLYVSPTNGNGSGSVTVTVIPTGLGYGTYSGTITITPSGMSPLTASVTLTISTTGTLSFSPSSLTFNYTTGGSIPAAQPLSVAGASGQTFTAQPSNGASWLLINGSNGMTAQLGFPNTLNISVNPTGINATVSGSVILSSTDGSTASIPVSLVLNGTTGLISISTNNVVFSSAVGVTPNPQGVTVSTTAASASYTATSYAAWLYVGTSGQYTTSGAAFFNTPSTLNLYVNPSGLSANTYTGVVTVNSGSNSYSINVSYIVGGSGGGTITGFIVAPTQLDFTMQSGFATAPQKIAVTG